MARSVKLRKERKSSKIYIAVVIDEELSSRSLRKQGDWAAFVGRERAQVAERALRAKFQWEASGVYGPYRVLTGELTSEITQNSKFAVSRIKQG